MIGAFYLPIMLPRPWALSQKCRFRYSRKETSAAFPALIEALEPVPNENWMLQQILLTNFSLEQPNPLSFNQGVDSQVLRDPHELIIVESD